MQIKFFIEECRQPDGKVYDTFDIKEPHKELGVIGMLSFNDVDYVIKWVEDIIIKNIPDFSFLSNIEYQDIQFGSNKSRIVEYDTTKSKFIEKAEFYTKDFVQLLKEWKKFLGNKKKSE